MRADSDDDSIASTHNLFIYPEHKKMLAIDECPEDYFSLEFLPQEKDLLPSYTLHDNCLEPSPGSMLGDSYFVSPANADKPGWLGHADDDSAVTSKPSRQVDYLSHDWREEDIWSSWRYIISKRDGSLNSGRLENASWRAWMQSKNNLKMISPTKLNWFKDFDITWLYGPLKSSSTHFSPTKKVPPSSTDSVSDSLLKLNKKPILKKRRASELMLPKLLMADSHCRQDTANVQAQESAPRANFPRASTDCNVTLPLSSRGCSHGVNIAVTQSMDSSCISRPFRERKHIQFNQQVEQCIAVGTNGKDDEVGLDQGSDDNEYNDDENSRRTPVNDA